MAAVKRTTTPDIKKLGDRVKRAKDALRDAEAKAWSAVKEVRDIYAKDQATAEAKLADGRLRSALGKLTIAYQEVQRLDAEVRRIKRKRRSST